MPQASLKQASINYRVLGPQDSPYPPVLFVHGVLCDDRLWAKVTDELAQQGFCCIAPTWPLGSHTVPVNEGTVLSPHSIATMIHDFMIALDLSDVTLVGNDAGGALCQLLIDTYPDRVGRLVLTNCDAFDKSPPFPFTVVFALFRGPKSIKALFAMMRLTTLRHSPLGYELINDPDPALTSSWLEPCRKDSRICRDLAAFLRHVATADLIDVSTRLNAFTKPVTVVWGMRDRFFTPALGKRLAELFPNSTIIEVTEAKTFVPLDNPSAVIDAVATISTQNT